MAEGSTAVVIDEVVELGTHLEGYGFKLVQSQKSRAKMRSRATAFGRGEALSTVTDKKLQELSARKMYINACAAQ